MSGTTTKTDVANNTLNARHVERSTSVLDRPCWTIAYRMTQPSSYIISGRLIDAGGRAVKLAREREEDTSIVHVDTTWSLPAYHPWDHPDYVLARAVAQAVIDLGEHLLISATRLDDLPLRVVAAKIGIVAGGLRNDVAASHQSTPGRRGGLRRQDGQQLRRT
jgi:hypothetical protein